MAVGDWSQALEGHPFTCYRFNVWGQRQIGHWGVMWSFCKCTSSGRNQSHSWSSSVSLLCLSRVSKSEMILSITGVGEIKNSEGLTQHQRIEGKSWWTLSPSSILGCIPFVQFFLEISQELPGCPGVAEISFPFFPGQEEKWFNLVSSF